MVPSRPREPDNPSEGHTALRIGTPNTAAALTGRASEVCWREAKRPVSRGVIVHSTTACRWQSHLADYKRLTDTFGSAIHKAWLAPEELSFAMLGKFPMGDRWAMDLYRDVLPASRLRNVQTAQHDAVASRLAKVWMTGGKNFARFTERIRAAYATLDQAFDQTPEQVASVVYETFHQLGELQQREFSLESDARKASDDNLEARFGSLLKLCEFLHERYHRTLAAPFVAADAITRTGEATTDLIDADGRVTTARVRALEVGRRLRDGTLTDGVERHLRNSAAHHLYTILSDDRIRLWDVDPKTGQRTWGPVEWTWWELRTQVYDLSHTCSVLLLALALFDIANGRTIHARGWSVTAPPQPRLRDIVKSELKGMAERHGFTVESVEVAKDGALAIGLQVKGDEMPDQTTRIVVGGPTREHYQRHVRTEWGPLRDQVYGFLQMTFGVHDGYDVVRVTVASRDGKTALGQVDAPRVERQAMLHSKEPAEAIRARLPVDTLPDERIPVILEGPIVPAV